MKEKICPIMAQGWINGYISNQFNTAMNSEEAIKRLPKCLKENCALWVEEDGLGKQGYCGLINGR